MKNEILSDIKKIKKALGTNFISCYSFGSYRLGRILKGDIDLMIRVNEIGGSVSVLKNLDNLNISIGKISLNRYDGYSGTQLKYDLVLVDDNNLKGYFIKRNKKEFNKIHI